MTRRMVQIVSSIWLLLALIATPACSQASVEPTWAPPTLPPTAEPAPNSTATQSITAAPNTSSTPFEPTAAPDPSTAVIKINNNDLEFDHKEGLERLNRTLQENGINGRIELVPVSLDENGAVNTASEQRKKIMAGSADADAYLQAYADSAACFAGGYTRDMTDLVSQYAPGYNAKYHDLFPEKLSGIPVGIVSKPVLYKPVLMLRDDFTDRGRSIQTLDDVYAFADQTVMDPKNDYVLIAAPDVLLAQWVSDSGYYQLGQFGPYVYAAMDDPACKPVLLEKIPGFRGFIERMFQYYQTGRISGFEAPPSTQTIGYLRFCGDFFFNSLYSWMPWLDGEYTAQELSPGLPGYLSERSYSSELSVPVSTPMEKAVEIVRFVEWYNESQEHYDAVIYGKKDVDYKLDGNRFVPLQDGKEKTVYRAREAQFFFFTWPGTSYLFNMDYLRLPHNAPKKIEEINSAAVFQNQRLPDRKWYRSDWKTVDEFKKLLGNRALGVGDTRMRIFLNLLYFDHRSFTPAILEDALVTLANQNNKDMLEAYEGAIAKMMAKYQK